MTKKKEVTDPEVTTVSPEMKSRLEKDMLRMQRKFIKGYRIVECPQCKHPSRGKWLVEVIQCSKCGYHKTKI